MKYILLILFSVCLCATANAQAARKLDQNSIVKDSNGMVYPYAVWQALMMNGGYSLRTTSKADETPVFFLVKLTEQEKLMHMENFPKPKPSEYFRVGRPFPDFKGSSIDNSKLNTKDMAGKILVINFWFINCPPCRKEIPDLNEMVERFRGNDNVRFLAIALDSKADLKNFLGESPYNYEVLYNGSYLADKYGVKAYPTHVIVDQEGKIYFSATGLAPNTVFWLRKSITELLSGEKSEAK